MKYLFVAFQVFCCAVFGQDKNADFAEYAKQFQKQQQNKTNSQSNLPKKDISKHVRSITALDKPGVLSMYSALQAAKKKNLTQAQLHDLDELHKQSVDDSSIVNTAMMLYAAGIKTEAPIYLITSVSDKTNPLFVNDLGVILKDNEEYSKAIQCFLYADKNVKFPSAIIKTNLGWASAYYGDFEAAKKYFNDALKFSPFHDGALEGLCNIAFAEGDYRSLTDNLYKRIKISGMGGGGGNINQFVAPGLIDDVLNAYEENPELKKSDPFENHLFDNSSSEDNVDNPGGATEIVPKLPAITAYFSYDAFTLNSSMEEIRNLKKEIIKDEENDISKLKAELSSLPPWKKNPYVNEQGDMIYPYNYESEYRMFERLTVEFNKRDIWLAKNMIKEELAFEKTIQAGEQLVKMSNACAGKTNCTCEWAKPNIGVVNSDLSGYFGFWSKCYKQWLENVNWYISASSAYIKKVHHPKLNAYLNDKREAVVKDYILSKYSAWLDDCLRVGGEIDMLSITKECVDNPPKVNTRGEENSWHGIKKLKRWPEPCVVPTGDYDYEQLPVGMVMTCDELKLRVGVKKKLGDVVKVSAAIHLDFKYGENEKQDETKLYFDAGIKAGIKKDLPLGEYGADVGVKETAFIQLKDGKINYGVENPELSGSVGAKSTEITKIIEKEIPGGEAKVSGGVVWTAETGAKMKINGNKMDLPKNPIQ